MGAPEAATTQARAAATQLSLMQVWTQRYLRRGVHAVPQQGLSAPACCSWAVWFDEGGVDDSKLRVPCDSWVRSDGLQR